ncbi:MAG: alpha-L-arabinofuranosidase C-terminal domain-containing protein [Capsulimonas sp.]|uniref:alpha-L-arabinofuranosidase C-terminal domain-containing protein n=1 Tax=Capsulimonas sp. TaxID=2494211 RepID=UPI003266313F
MKITTTIPARTFGAALFMLMTAVSAPVIADPGSLTVHADRPGPKINPLFYGLMTEDINYSWDGGLYAELIRNRSFKDSGDKVDHWSTVAPAGASVTMSLDRAEPVSAALGASLRVEVTGATASAPAGIANHGYFGVPVKPSTKYAASFYARCAPGFSGPLLVSLQSADGRTTFAKAQVTGLTGKWKKYSATLQTPSGVAATTAGQFVLMTDRPGTVWLSLVSLFPPTYKGRPNGLRVDLMNKLAAMKPGFIRLPGGCYIEGYNLASHFDWKKTIGPLEDRPGHPGFWGYRATDGMGLLELLQWCEDLNAEPVLAVFNGYAMGDTVQPGPALEPYVQDVLDEIEYVTGDGNTKWGAVRARNGHPKPFPLHYVEIGNEDWGDKSGSYDARYVQFYHAIKAKYPHLQVIATTAVKSIAPDVLDDHFYRSTGETLRDVSHYDKYDRKGPQVFVGEWATTEGKPTPTYEASLADAAWLIGLERNADAVAMECYAPLFVNVNPGASQWDTNLIGYDGVSSFGSPSYHMQCLFGGNRGSVVLPVDFSVPQNTTAPDPMPQGRVGVGSWATQVEYKDIVVTQDDRTLYKADLAAGVADWRFVRGDWKVQDGALQQSGNSGNCQAFVGDASWTDYSLRLKARKISGEEGFRIFLHVQGEKDFISWTIGDAGNTHTAIEKKQNGYSRGIGGDAAVKVETGRWYDIRVDVHGRQIACYLDGKLISEATDKPFPPAPTFFATASRDDKTQDIIIKAVNASAAPQVMALGIDGVPSVASAGTQWVMTGSPKDVNSIAEPQKVAPRKLLLNNAGRSFTHEFPANSVTVLRPLCL